MPSFYSVSQKFNEGDENLYFAQLTEAISAVLAMRVSMSGSLTETLRTIGMVVGTVKYVTIADCVVE